MQRQKKGEGSDGLTVQTTREESKGEKRFIIIPLLTPRRTDQTPAMADGEE